MLEIEYIVEDAGWADCRINNGETVTECNVSYLHDTLLELAQSAIKIQNRKNVSVVFMSEPGEHQLILNRINETDIDFELRWYSDWASLGMYDENDFEIMQSGKTTVAKYVNQIRNLMLKIMDEIGAELYNEKWVSHEFPIAEFNQLK